jgi:serine/threonine protein kinase
MVSPALVGTRLGPYEITGAIGSGGMGEVYRARDTRLGRDVALKLLAPAFASDLDRLARFDREAKLLASLNHPNIAHVYGFENASLPDGTTVNLLAMELVDGEDLAERLARGPVPVDEALAIARQIAEAVEAAHEKGIVHRDLKPANVKLKPDGTVKVLDFGLAKAWSGDAGSSNASDPALSRSPTLSRTADGLILGTAAYMSPEQARGKPVDQRSDLWSLGVVLFEMLTGTRPFEGETVSDTLAAVLTRELKWESLPGETPASIRRLLRRCLQRDRRMRLASAADARLEIDDAAQSAEGVAVRPPFPWTRTALVSLVSLIGGAVVARFGMRTANQEPVRLEILTDSGIDSDPAASPDGKTIAYSSSREGKAQIWLRQLDGGGETARTAGPFDSAPRFSPDGSFLLFKREAAAGSLLLRTPTLGGEEHRVVSNALAADWSPDGSLIAFVGEEDGVLYTVHPDGSGKQELRRFPEERPVSLAWSPDGRLVALHLVPRTGARAGRLAVIPLDGGDARTLHTDPFSSLTSSLAWSGSGRALLYAVGEGTSLDQGIAIKGTGRVVSHDVETDQVRTLFWTAKPASNLAVAGTGSLLFDATARLENLRSVPLLPHHGLTGSTWLTRGSCLDRQPAFSPDGRLVVFSSNRGGNLDLWTLSRSDGRIRRITDDAARDWDPAFTSDGAGILWSSERGGHLEVWIAALDGSAARQVTRDGVDAENPTMTRDGRWIVYASADPSKRGIWKIHPDGSGAVSIALGPFFLPEVSPDGRFVAYLDSTSSQPRRTIRVRRVEDGSEVPPSIGIDRNGNEDSNFGRPRWLPGGSALAFLAADTDGLSGVFAQDFVPGKETSATRRRLAGFFPDVRSESFGFAPDGSEIVLSGLEEHSQVLLARGIPDLLPPVRGRRP